MTETSSIQHPPKSSIKMTLRNIRTLPKKTSSSSSIPLPPKPSIQPPPSNIQKLPRKTSSISSTQAPSLKPSQILLPSPPSPSPSPKISPPSPSPSPKTSPPSPSPSPKTSPLDPESECYTFTERTKSGQSQSLTIHRPVNRANLANVECFTTIEKWATKMIEPWEVIDEIVLSAGTEGTVVLSPETALDQIFQLKPKGIAVYHQVITTMTTPNWPIPAKDPRILPSHLRRVNKETRRL
jgi:hypothetical protein